MAGALGQVLFGRVARITRFTRVVIPRFSAVVRFSEAPVRTTFEGQPWPPHGDHWRVLDLVSNAAAEFAKAAAEHDRSGVVPSENFERLSQAGLLALTVPQSLGGGGAGLALSVDVITAMARGEPSTALILAFHYMHHATIGSRWPQQVVQRLGREAVAGTALINALRVEPELGTPARGGLPATLARRTGDGWRLSGRKIYVTGSSVLSWLAVWARTDEANPRVGTLLVPARAPGVQVIES